MARAAERDCAADCASGSPSRPYLSRRNWPTRCDPICCAISGLEVTPVNLRDAAEIERGLTAFARGPKDALIVTASPLAFGHRDLIVTRAAKYKLAALYP